MRINEIDASIINEFFNVSCCVAGQKVSRVINAICCKHNLNKHPEYNKIFAKISDQLNPLGDVTMTRKEYETIDQMLISVGEIALEDESKRDMFKAGYHARAEKEKERRQELCSMLNDLRRDGLKVEAVINAANSLDCDDGNILVSVASDCLQEMLARLEIIICRYTAKEDAA